MCRAMAIKAMVVLRTTCAAVNADRHWTLYADHTMRTTRARFPTGGERRFVAPWSWRSESLKIDVRVSKFSAPGG